MTEISPLIHEVVEKAGGQPQELKMSAADIMIQKAVRKLFGSDAPALHRVETWLDSDRLEARYRARTAASKQWLADLDPLKVAEALATIIREGPCKDVSVADVSIEEQEAIRTAIVAVLGTSSRHHRDVINLLSAELLTFCLSRESDAEDQFLHELDDHQVTSTLVRIAAFSPESFSTKPERRQTESR